MLQNAIHDVEREYNRLNISEVSRRTGFNRRTVMKYARPNKDSLQRKTTTREGKLTPYHEFIQSELRIHPAITGVKLFEKLQKQGYTGHYSILTDYLRKIRPKKPQLAVPRYETEPGEQAQADWGTLCRVEIDGKMRNVYVFVMILGYSRTVYAEITTSQSELVFLQCHIHAFNYFGGIPERILYDNTKTVIIKKSFDYEKNVWNQNFLDFATYYGFKPYTHVPGRPETKGKVERAVRYVETSFFNGGEFSSLEDMQIQLQEWLTKANSRIHGTTKKVPFDELQVELPKLHSITAIPPYPIVITEERKISADACISFKGNKYSVPYQYARKNAILKIKETCFSVLCDNEEICTHRIIHGTGHAVILKEHSHGLLKEIYAANRKKPDVPKIYEMHFKDMEVEERSLSSYDLIFAGDKGT